MDSRTRFKTLVVLFTASTVLTGGAAALGWWLQGWLGLIAGVLVAGVLGDIPIAISLNRQRRLVGPEALVGRDAVVERAFVNGLGQVRLDGAIWKARLSCTHSPSPGERVRVESVDSAVLTVGPAEPESRNDRA